MAKGASQDRGEFPHPHPGCYFLFFLVVVGANVIDVSSPTIVIGLMVGLMVGFFLVVMTCSFGARCPRGCAMARRNVSNPASLLRRGLHNTRDRQAVELPRPTTRLTGQTPEQTLTGLVAGMLAVALIASPHRGQSK